MEKRKIFEVKKQLKENPKIQKIYSKATTAFIGNQSLTNTKKKVRSQNCN